MYICMCVYYLGGITFTPNKQWTKYKSKIEKEERIIWNLTVGNLKNLKKNNTHM